MRFAFEQRWDSTVDQIIAIYTDQTFWTSLANLSATTAPAVQAIEHRGNTTVVSLHYTLAVELPKEAARFINLDRVAWVEETTWNLRDYTASVRFLPDQAGRLIRASASTRLVPQGQGTVVRSINGDIKVQIPLLGSRVERVIVDGVGEHLEAEALAVSERLG